MPLPSLWLPCVQVRPLFSQCTSQSLLVQWEFPVINAGKVRHGSRAPATVVTHFATVCRVVCCSKTSKVFRCSNIMKVLLFRYTGQNHLSYLLFAARGFSLLNVQLEGHFSFFFALSARQECSGSRNTTAPHLNWKATSLKNWSGMTQSAWIFGKGTINSVGGPTAFVLRLKI